MLTLGFPVVRLLVCDDAPQFTLVTEELALCWVHEGRHYKKLVPYVPHHHTLVEAFVERFWTYYDQLLAYREHADARGGWAAGRGVRDAVCDGHGLRRPGRADCQDAYQERRAC